MFITPVVTIPIIWRKSSQPGIIKILIGLVTAFCISILFFWISLSICFRNGMGPT